MQTQRTLLCGQKGAKKFLDRYGGKLVRVHYHNNRQYRKRGATMEFRETCLRNSQRPGDGARSQETYREPGTRNYRARKNMPDKLRELKKRISKLPNGELLRIVNDDSEGYRPEAVIFAKEELEARGPISFQESVAEGSNTVKQSSHCRICGGPMRSGLLSTEKELMIIFTDDGEERYLDALACTECGEVRFVVDFETDV